MAEIKSKNTWMSDEVSKRLVNGLEATYKCELM